VGVGGNGNYLPFLRVADALRIPFFIFSDGEPATKESVKKQFVECGSTKQEKDVVIFQGDGNDFERQLLEDGYNEEIRESIIRVEIPKCQNTCHKAAKEREIASYDKIQLHKTIDDSKTQYAAVIAEVIIERRKPLPPRIVDLFHKINSLLGVFRVRQILDLSNPTIHATLNVGHFSVSGSLAEVLIKGGYENG